MKKTIVKKSVPFKKKETGYHLSAKNILADWTGGIAEVELKHNGSIVIVPDIAVYKDNVLSSVYEIVHSHPLTGRKLGMYDYWCYMNGTSLSVFEVSADYVLAQTEKPEFIQTMECYIIEPF